MAWQGKWISLRCFFLVSWQTCEQHMIASMIFPGCVVLLPSFLFGALAIHDDVKPPKMLTIGTWLISTLVVFTTNARRLRFLFLHFLAVSFAFHQRSGKHTCVHLTFFAVLSLSPSLSLSLPLSLSLSLPLSLSGSLSLSFFLSSRLTNTMGSHFPPLLLA